MPHVKIFKNPCFIFLSLILLLSPSALAQDIKNADFSGTWYSANAQKLSDQIKNYLDIAKPATISGDIIALISPHAGMQFSGQVGAYGFKIVQNKKIDTVIVIGFSHKLGFDGIAVFDKDGIRTPLGVLYTDKQLTRQLLNSNKKFLNRQNVFDEENSIELILPFIQVALGNPKIVLLAIGNQTLENSEIAGICISEALKDKKNFLIVASSDMSHFLPYEQAKEVDKLTADLIKQMDPEKLFLTCHDKNRMCGTASVSAAIIAAKKLGANKAIILNLANAADTASGLIDRNSVVGYLSAALVKENDKNITENTKMDYSLSDQQKKKLLKIARDTITQYLNSGKILDVLENDPALTKVMGAFVTLNENGQLRGCIGNIIGQKPLYLTVRDMAIAAATEDPRFNSVTKDELKNVHIEISVLSPLEKITNPEKIVLGKHGVLVKDLFRSGVYLPQVATETGWTKEQFMDSLCGNKAGMAPDAWKKGKCEIYIFSAEVFAE
jgi:AmmeMemoRadiSam system protein B/AmmeMemoRadiSam system protein A